MVQALPCRVGGRTNCAHISSWLGLGGCTFHGQDFRVALETHLTADLCAATMAPQPSPRTPLLGSGSL